MHSSVTFKSFVFVLINSRANFYLLGGLYMERQFTGWVFALQVYGDYIWKGSYMEGLIFGIVW